MKKFSYTTSGTCSKLINFSLDENNIIHDVEFIGGCNGNLQGISKLIEVNLLKMSLINVKVYIVVCVLLLALINYLEL
mgnify:FL=1